MNTQIKHFFVFRRSTPPVEDIRNDDLCQSHSHSNYIMALRSMVLRSVKLPLSAQMHDSIQIAETARWD